MLDQPEINSRNTLPRISVKDRELEDLLRAVSIYQKTGRKLSPNSSGGTHLHADPSRE